jgi:hypothetical protein
VKPRGGWTAVPLRTVRRLATGQTPASGRCPDSKSQITQKVNHLPMTVHPIMTRAVGGLGSILGTRLTSQIDFPLIKRRPEPRDLIAPPEDISRIRKLRKIIFSLFLRRL